MTALRRPGLRFLVEAVVIVLTAVLTGLGHLGAWGIGGAVAVVWVVVAVIEYSLSHPRDRTEPAPVGAAPGARPRRERSGARALAPTGARGRRAGAGART